MNEKRVGEFLKEQRIKSNLTQDELASKLYVSRYVVSKWERGIRIPTTDYLTKLSTILNVNVTDILNGGIVNNENLNEVTIDIIKYKDKKINHLMHIMFLSIIFLIVIFSTIFLINNFNSIKVYNVVGSAEKYKLEDGLISLSKENVHMNLGYINSDTYMKYKLYFILDNNKYLIQGSDDNYIVYTNTFSPDEDYDYDTFKKALSNLYIDIYDEDNSITTIKLNTNIIFKNDKLFYHKYKKELEPEEWSNDTVVLPSYIKKNFKLNNNTKKYEIAYKENGCDYSAEYVPDTNFNVIEKCSGFTKTYFYFINEKYINYIYESGNDYIQKDLFTSKDYKEKAYLYFKKKFLFMLD